MPIIMPTRCQHTQQQHLFAARDYISGDSFALSRCVDCGLVRTLPRPELAQMNRYYPDSYYGREKRYGLLVERALTWLYASRARRLERVSGKKRARVLDIGCGRGLLLHQLRRRGWDVHGTELTDTSARYAREVLGIDVKVGDLASSALPEENFHVVVLWHVLEHVADPAGLLDEIARILRPGGVLLAAVPNFASAEARSGKAHWFHLDVPRHLYHFTPESLGTMIEAAGLVPAKSSYLAPEYDFFSFVQTALNMIGIRHNLLYNLMRAHGAKVLQDQPTTGIGETVATLVLTPILGAMSLAWVPLVALLGRGATVILYARKP